jgi:hypothetical protein
MKVLIALTLLISLDWAQAATKVAVVKILRGEVNVVAQGTSSVLKANQWVEEGSVIKTGEKSFVKLVLIDKSQMNIGPSSEMKIEKFSGQDAGVIDLVKGKVRSQVTKDYLQMKDKDKSKLFIKTPNAVMGIRGTDFMISTNGVNTAAVLFEGSVVFNKLDNPREISSSNLEAIVDRGVRMHPGEFSVMDRDHHRPTEPSLLNIQQRETLEKNETFDVDRSPSNSAPEEAKKSIVPEGLDGAVVGNNPASLKKEAQPDAITSAPKKETPPAKPEGFIAGDKIKPANGSFVHIESGTIIPPGSDSVLDPNTNAYIPTPKQGTVNKVGEYVPPKNVEITKDGKILVNVKDSAGTMRVQQVEKPAPIMNKNVPLGKIGEVIRANPGMINPNLPVKNDILNNNFVQNGLTDLSNQQRNVSGGVTTVNDAVKMKTTTTTTIRIKN